MRRSVICDRGDVAIVPFPFADMAISKMRPALVLSKRQFNEENGNTVLAMITTAKRSAWPSDVHLQEASAAGLHADCYVRWKIFTLPNDLLRRLAGALSTGDSVRVRNAANGIFT